MIERARDGDVEILAPGGARDLREVVEAAEAALGADARALVIDLARVPALRGDDIERLLRVRDLCAAKAAPLALAGASRESTFAIETLDLGAEFPYRFPDRAAALETLRRSVLAPPGESPMEIGFDPPAE